MQNVASNELRAVIDGARIPDGEKKQIATAFDAVMKAFTEHTIDLVPALVALAYVSGFYIALVPPDHRERLYDQIGGVQRSAARLSDSTNPVPFDTAGCIADTQASALVLQAKLSNAMAGIPYSVVMTALVEMIAEQIVSLRPVEYRTRIGKGTLRILRQMINEPVEDTPLH